MATSTKNTTKSRAQPLLPNLPSQFESGGVANIGDVFKNLYYFLYSNSNASRAERIFENLSLILLLKYSVDHNGGADSVASFIEGRTTADDLFPLISKYLPDSVAFDQHFTLEDEAIRGAMRVLSDVDLSASPAHVIGEAFQSLMGPRLRGDRGQFFTPRSLVQAIVEIIDPSDGEAIIDPACGTGGFLGETYTYLRKSATGELGASLIGIDKDPDMARLATALLRIGTDGMATARNQNSLDLSSYPESPEQQFDVVLTNPPFGSKIPITDKELLAKYSFGKRWVNDKNHGWYETQSVHAAQDPQVLFIELCVRLLKPGGRMGIVLPEGLFGNRQQGFIWEWLRKQGEISALLDCPRTTFQPGTDTKTNVLIFRKHPEDQKNKRRAKTKIAVALECGHDRRGRTRRPDGSQYPNDFAQIGTEYNSKSRSKRWWKSVELSNPDYLVPRYYARDHVLTPSEAEIVANAEHISLDDLMQDGVLTIRKGHEVGSDAYGTGDIPFVRTSDIANFEISADPTKSVSEEVYSQYAKQQKLKTGDVLMVVDGRYRIGATALLSQNNSKCVVQSHLRIISISDEQRLSPFELLFALNLPSVRLKIRDLVFVQSTLGTLGKRLLELEIPILHGNGPWTQRLMAFEKALVQRDQLLADLQSMRGPEFEL